MTSTLEIERKFEVPEDLELPDLSGAGGATEVVDLGVAELRATYFDTADLRLAAAGVTVRRRTGGDDEGWHLKLPTGKDRFELGLPLSRAKHTVPKEFRDSLRAITGGEELHPCCVITTRRQRYQLENEDTGVLAEVADDLVTAERAGPLTDDEDTSDPEDGDAVRSWREWEVELRNGPRSVLDEVAERLTQVGARESSWGSKLSRTLQVSVPQGPRTPSKAKKKSSAAQVLDAKFAQLWAEYRLRDVAVRRDLPDAVHQLRVSVRRLRSLLATYRPLLDREVSEPLREELKWLGDLLGKPRDAEVVRDLVLSAQDQLPRELVRGDLGRGVGQVFEREYAEGHADLIAAMDSERYWRLHDALERFSPDPPWRGKASKRASKVLPARVAKEWRRVEKRMTRVAKVGPDDETAYAERLHDARKAAKRLRHAAEAAEPVTGKDARRLGKAAKRFQSHVGKYNDSRVVRERLLHLADTASPGAGEAFTLGALYGRVQRTGDELVAEVPQRWKRLSRRKLRSWLD